MIGDEVGLGCGFDHHFVVVSTVTDEGPVAVERVESNVDFHLRREELVRVESRNLSQRQVEGLVPQVARGTASVVRGGENFSMGKVGITASVEARVNGHVALQDTSGFFVVIGHVEKGPEPLYHGKRLGCGLTWRPLILISMCEKGGKCHVLNHAHFVVGDRPVCFVQSREKVNVTVF